MPAIAAHYYFGQLVFNSLGEKAKRMANCNKPVYDLGLQGPDIFFYYRPFMKNKVNKYGREIHAQKANIFFAKALEKIKKDGDCCALSYLLGFVCHWMLDSTFHGKISEVAPGPVQHEQLETEIDRQIIVSNYSKRPEVYKRYELIKIKPDFVECLHKSYSDLSSSQIKDSVDSMRNYNKFLYSPGGKKRKLLYAVETIIGIKDQFTSLMVGNRADIRYYKPAYDIIGKFDKCSINTVAAIDNIIDCFDGKAKLSPIFNKDFK